MHDIREETKQFSLVEDIMLETKFFATFRYLLNLGSHR